MNYKKINKKKTKWESDTERKTLYVCVLGKLLRGGWGLWKATLLMSRPVSIKGLIQVARGVSLALFLLLSTRTHTLTCCSTQTPEDPKRNIIVYCSCSQSKNNIWSSRINLEWGWQEGLTWLSEKWSGSLFIPHPSTWPKCLPRLKRIFQLDAYLLTLSGLGPFLNFYYKCLFLW